MHDRVPETSCLIAEDEPLLATFLMQIFEKQPWVRSIQHVARCDDLMRQLRTSPPSLLILDLGLADGSSMPLISQIRMISASTKILVFTQNDTEEVVIEAFARGADGYLLKDPDEQLLVDSVKAQLCGGTPISPAIAGYLVKNIRSCFRADNPLSERESEVLNILAKGYSYAECANILGIKRPTIATYIRRIYEKLGVNSRTEAVFEARNSGWIK